jgi:hypothetical protein
VTIFLITLAVFAVAMAAMAIGVIVSNRCIKGSCGGLANLRDENGKSLCESCSNANTCPDRLRATEESVL